MSAASQRRLIDELKERIRRIERRPARREGFLPSGRPEVDALLPGGGFPRGALAQLAGGPASGKTLLALSALAAAAAEGGLAAFVDGRGELYPPAAGAVGLDLARLLVVRPPPTPRGAASGARWGGCGQEALAGLWAAEALLGSGAFAAVAVDVPLRGLAAGRAEPMLRRLATAAEKGGAVGLWLGAPAGCRVPSAVRLDLGSPPSTVSIAWRAEPSASTGSGRALPEGEGGGRPFRLGVRTGLAGGGGRAA